MKSVIFLNWIIKKLEKAIDTLSTREAIKVLKKHNRHLPKRAVYSQLGCNEADLYA